MPTLIRTDGSELEVTPRNGTRLSLEELYALVGNGCDIVQAVPISKGRTLWCDEESKCRPAQGTSRTINEKATRLLQEAGGIPGDYVLGNVVITGERKIKAKSNPQGDSNDRARRETHCEASAA